MRTSSVTCAACGAGWRTATRRTPSSPTWTRWSTEIIIDIDIYINLYIYIQVEQEDFALTVADAPSVAVNRVATYTELDNDLFKHAAFATLEEIDLRWHYLHIYISTYLHI